MCDSSCEFSLLTLAIHAKLKLIKNIKVIRRHKSSKQIS